MGVPRRRISKRRWKSIRIMRRHGAIWARFSQDNPKPTEARAAWEKAVQADPKYIKPYIQLARLDMEEKQPEDAITIAGKAVAMNPLEFPELYFCLRRGKLQSEALDVAETNARRATDLDHAHEVPRAELLLGSVLVAKGDRAGALQHFRKYLEIVPKAQDAEQIKRAIAQLEAPPERRSNAFLYLPCTSFMTPEA